MLFPAMRITHLALLSILIATAGSANVRADSPEGLFYKAYYLENEHRDMSAAAEMYSDIVQTRGVSPALRERAQTRLEICREELATEDFARLMPPQALAYIEVNRPSERIGKLLDQLGLLATPDNAPTEGQNCLAISPSVIDALLGMRGMAAAVTGFNMATQEPTGVAVLHAGNMTLVRGLIETALPAGASPVSAIKGYPTYEIENVLITLTHRLVIAGTSETEIKGVLQRMRDPDDASLATNEDMADILEERDGALVYFCINPKPIMPLVQPMLTGAMRGNRELALAQALLDIPSFRSLSGRFDISDQGLVFELSLRLDEGHRNLVYNFLRRPGVDPETLRCIPEGAAAFAALAMNEAPDHYPKVAPAADEEPIVTALDLGREFFANINGIAIFALPPDGSSKHGGPPIPDVAAVITVNDPNKSAAIWLQLLGLASVAAGAPTMEGQVHDVAGVDARSYQFEDDVTVHFATTGHSLFVASTDSALERSIRAHAHGRSVLDDDAFHGALGSLGEQTTMVLVANTGRCMELARPFMSPDDLAEAEPFFELLQETTGSVLVNHSAEKLQFAARVTGVPNIGSFVNRMLTEELHGQKLHQEMSKARYREDWDEVVTLLNKQLDSKPDDADVLRKKFYVLAVHKGDQTAAAALADDLYAAMKESPRALNNFAWDLLTDDDYGQRFNKLARRLARRCNELTDHSIWQYVDTLALAEFATGNAEAAVKLEKKAIKLCEAEDGSGLDELQKALARFENAADAER